MSHLDEGTLHALLDGELDLAEISEVQKHLGTCVACGSRLQEVKQVLAESDRLVGALEVPAGAAHSRPEPQRPEPQFRATREPEAWNEPPVLLVPDPIDADARRRRWMRGLRWAAVLVVIVTGSKMVSNALRPSHPMLPERDLTSAAPAVPPAVASPQETRRAETTTVLQSKSARAQPRPPAARAPVRPAPAAEQPSDETAGEASESVTLAAQDTVAAADTQELAAAAKKDSLTQPAVAVADVPDSATVQRVGNDEARIREEDDLATRRAAAAAMAELDRERRRERANAATAALPPPARPEVQTEPEPAPRPPTLEQRAQVYLRIGLDEAVKQLGGPVHVIEGMTPQFIGLTRAQLIPGTTSNRPVVRVVYLDARGRMILLDQQRTEADQAPSNPSGSLRWSIGDVMLYLRGEPGSDVLRSLQARVR